jgi:hypothetical protein
MDAPIFIVWRWDPDFHVHINDSNLAIETMLIQNPTGKCNQPITYVFRLLNNIECNYTITNEALAMVYTLHKFQHYLLSNEFVFYVDHMALLYLIKKPQVSKCIAHWFSYSLNMTFWWCTNHVNPILLQMFCHNF